jgi:hypothetical protein
VGESEAVSGFESASLLMLSGEASEGGRLARRVAFLLRAERALFASLRLCEFVMRTACRRSIVGAIAWPAMAGVIRTLV